MKKLIGKNAIEDALKRLDRLTQEEAQMAAAQLLEIANAIHGEVGQTADGIDRIEREVGQTADGVDRIERL